MSTLELEPPVRDSAVPLVSVDGLSVTYRVGRDHFTALEEVQLDVRPHEILAIVGESGSGKTTLGNSISAMLPENATVRHGEVRFAGQQLLRMRERQLRRLRGRSIGVIPQDPMTSLNPTKKVGIQVAEPLLLHKILERSQVESRVRELIEEVGLWEVDRVLRSYPHQLSGGMKQRALAAMALAADPELVVADEPTSALDVTLAKRVMDRLEELVRSRGTALVIITHDLGLAAHRADRIAVMRAGRIVEFGTREEIVSDPKDGYVRELLANAPHLKTVGQLVGSTSTSSLEPRQPSAAADFDPSNDHSLLRVEGLTKQFPGADRLAVDEVSFAIPRGKVFSIVGESGSGKSTLARMVLRLEEPTAGRVEFDGQDITRLRGEELRLLRKRIQVVYQSPFDSLDPRMRVDAIVGEPLQAFGIGSSTQRSAKVTELLDAVGLPKAYARRRPFELSGGQRQRVAIARALAVGPELIVCDEPVSALDVLVQAQVLRLLRTLQEQFDVAYLFISHDLALVNHFADHVGIMNQGQLVETGPTDDVFANPRNAYTKTLLDSALNL